MAELPPRVKDRVHRHNTSSARTSLLTIADHMALESCGFAAVGDVQGSYALFSDMYRRSWGMSASRDNAGRFIDPPYVMVSDADRRRPRQSSRHRVAQTRPSNLGSFGGTSGIGNTFDRHLSWLRAGWDEALARLLAECKAIGADGVIGVVAEQKRFDRAGRRSYVATQGRREFTLTGTAVRSKGTIHLEMPFATFLVGPDVAKLFTGGYSPAGLVIGVAAAKRHNDYSSVQARRLSSGNVEVPGLSDLMTGVRAALRDEVARRSIALGGDGFLLSSKIDVELDQEECDLVAQATAFANIVVRFARAHVARRSPMTILTLG